MSRRLTAGMVILLAASVAAIAWEYMTTGERPDLILVVVLVLNLLGLISFVAIDRLLKDLEDD